MSNTLTNVMAKILSRGLLTLREQAAMPRLVNGDYSREAAERGDTIDVPIPTANSASDVTPSPTHSSATNWSPGKVQIQLNNWKKSNFGMSDKDMVEVDRNAHFMPMQAAEAIRALANAVNEDIHAEYAGIYGFVGTAGTTPFASTVNAATDARKVLHKQLAPRNDRRAVLDYDAEANALALAPFSDADKIGTNQVRIEGEIGRKYGIDWYADDAVVTHTAGSLAKGVVNTNAAAGASSISVRAASAAGNLLVGDIFTIAGQTQTYVVKATVSAIASNSAKTVTIDPPLVTAAASAAAITRKASHVVNIAFHRDAFAFANRPLADNTTQLSLGSQIMTMTDPQTGITLRLEVSRQYKQVTWEFDILWGAKLVRAALGTRIAG